MFDLKKYAENSNKKEVLKIRMQYIDELKSSVEKEYNAINNDCSHDLILKMKRIYKIQYYTKETPYYICVCCNKEMAEESIQESNVIDISELASEEIMDDNLINGYQENSGFVLRAQSKLNEIANIDYETITFSKNAIKEMLLQELKDYDKSLKGISKIK